MSLFKNLKGKKYGRLTVRRLATKVNGCTMWLCKCRCGTFITARSGSLRSGNTTSCGCKRTESVTKHGEFVGHRTRHTPEYSAWVAMLTRCRDESHVSYHNYGGRGIRVCERWSSFEHFLADVGRKPSPSHTLDRWPNKDGHYEPGNVRWATKKEQARNTRRNLLLTHDGRTLCVAEWAEILGVNRNTVYGRLNRGWTLAEALFGRSVTVS